MKRILKRFTLFSALILVLANKTLFAAPQTVKKETLLAQEPLQRVRVIGEATLRTLGLHPDQIEPTISDIQANRLIGRAEQALRSYARTEIDGLQTAGQVAAQREQLQGQMRLKELEMKIEETKSTQAQLWV